MSTVSTPNCWLFIKSCSISLSYHLKDNTHRLRSRFDILLSLQKLTFQHYTVERVRIFSILLLSITNLSTVTSHTTSTCACTSPPLSIMWVLIASLGFCVIAISWRCFLVDSEVQKYGLAWIELLWGFPLTYIYRTIK